MTDTTTHRSTARIMLSKVPEVTVWFWVIKVLCTTVGETFADNLNTSLGLGLSGTSLVMGSLLVVVLVLQLRARRYVPGLYWLTVVLVSVVGTLITDNLTDNVGISLVTTTVVFSVVLALVFAGWFASERTLSIHSILTTRREGWYWMAILFTFALGTAAGDLVAERLAVGYGRSVILFAVLIALVAAVHYALAARRSTHGKRHATNAVVAFWVVYILTRPLGASIGDFLSQAKADGGLGLGTTVTSAIFLAAILACVVYLSVTRVDRPATDGVAQSDALPVGERR